MMMFCACPVGQGLKKLSIEWRLKDMKTMAANIQPRLEEARSKLHLPTEAGKILDSLMDDIDDLIKKSAKALKSKK